MYIDDFGWPANKGCSGLKNELRKHGSWFIAEPRRLLIIKQLSLYASQFGLPINFLWRTSICLTFELNLIKRRVAIFYTMLGARRALALFSKVLRVEYCSACSYELDFELLEREVRKLDPKIRVIGSKTFLSTNGDIHRNRQIWGWVRAAWPTQQVCMVEAVNWREVDPVECSGAIVSTTWVIEI